MGAIPKLAEISCEAHRFSPGDRILVRTNSRLDPDQKRKLRAAITRWAGCDVEICIFCILDLEVTVEHQAAHRL